MPSQRVFQCRQQCDPLLAQGGKVTANTTKHRHPVFGAEAPGDLLLDFDHPQISLRLVVVKRYGKIEQEPQHGPLPPERRSSRLRAGLCLGRPGARLACSDCLGAAGGGLAWYPSARSSSYRRSKRASTSTSSSCWPNALACSTSAFMFSKSSFIFLAQPCLS